ncbi:MAG: SbmA/BacA-like family transporter [Methyloceanibacter sp.]|jgi:hypothetical protein
MDALHEISPALQQARLERRLFARFWQTASPFWFGRWAKVAWGLTVILMLVVLAQVLVQLLLNLWNRNFFDAVERRDASALWTQAKLFVPLALASIALAAISVWGRMTAQRKWRESVTRQVIEYWLAEDRFRRLDQLANGSENPEYRISEDVRIATDAPIDLVLAFLASVLTAITFLSVLWSVGGSLTFDAFGRSWTIPGYLVIGVIVYSTLFSGAMIIVGRRLTAIIGARTRPRRSSGRQRIACGGTAAGRSRAATKRRSAGRSGSPCIPCCCGGGASRGTCGRQWSPTPISSWHRCWPCCSARLNISQALCRLASSRSPLPPSSRCKALSTGSSTITGGLPIGGRRSIGSPPF